MVVATIYPHSYAAVQVAVEFMKCAPICPDHHKAIHKTATPAYDLVNDPFYKAKVKEFRSRVVEMLPPTLLDRVVSAVSLAPMGCR